MRKAGCMCMHPKLYVAGIQYGWRRLRGICGSTRKKLCVRETNSPLSAVRRGAHDASASGQGQCEDAYEPDDNRCIQHLSYSSMSLLRCFNNLPNVSIDPLVKPLVTLGKTLGKTGESFRRPLNSQVLSVSRTAAFLQLFYSFSRAFPQLFHRGYLQDI